MRVVGEYVGGREKGYIHLGMTKLVVVSLLGGTRRSESDEAKDAQEGKSKQKDSKGIRWDWNKEADGVTDAPRLSR